jgi:hypothetical protein
MASGTRRHIERSLIRERTQAGLATWADVTGVPMAA